MDRGVKSYIYDSLALKGFSSPNLIKTFGKFISQICINSIRDNFKNKLQVENFRSRALTRFSNYRHNATSVARRNTR